MHKEICNKCKKPMERKITKTFVYQTGKPITVINRICDKCIRRG